MSEEKIAITKAKGRPMLTWVGKRPLSYVTAFPAQHVETFDPAGEQGKKPRQPDAWADWPAAYPKGGLLFHGDNKEILAHLLANGFRGKVDLVYIDPPFDSGADYVRQIALRGATSAQTIAGEGYSIGEQVQYSDIWANDNYLQFLYERLLLLKQLLRNGGAIWVHCDWHRNHVIRCLLEEVFGSECMRNEIIWQRTASRNDAKAFGHVHDMLLYFVNGHDGHTWNQQHTPYAQEYLNRYYNLDDGDGRLYAADNLTAAGLRNGSSGRPWRGFDPGAEGRHWKYTTEKLDELDAQGRIYWPKGGKGFPRFKRYSGELPGKPVPSIWSDVFVINSQAAERGDYPTQKPEDLIRRIIEATSEPGDLVLDCFLGSGTTAAVAQSLGRRWIGCDINKGAIQVSSKRLQVSMRVQQNAGAGAKVESAMLPGMSMADSEGAKPEPAQGGFTVWRVNDYDLAIQHNEAVNLACEHIGVERTRSDTYFDGTLGRALVKIIPFGHPLSPLDLEELKRELEARPEEDRRVTVVCLGIELAAVAWVEDWNRLRKVKDSVNRVDVIELRSDAKYGRFIKHEPAMARVSVERKAGKLLVEIRDFISPSIIERLKDQSGLLAPKIDDWRAMVDCVMIDTAYDGQVFNVKLSDVPEKKTDLVLGKYELHAPDGDTTVAVKVIDMLGEEVLAIETA